MAMLPKVGGAILATPDLFGDLGGVVSGGPKMTGKLGAAARRVQADKKALVGSISIPDVQTVQFVTPPKGLMGAVSGALPGLTGKGGGMLGGATGGKQGTISSSISSALTGTDPTTPAFARAINVHNK